MGVIVPVGVGVGLGDTATVSRHSNWYHGAFGLVTLSSAKLFIIVLVINQEEEIIRTPMKVFQNIVLP